jgi:hypothetical protein
VAAAVAVPSVGAQRGSVAGAVPRLVFPLVAKTVLWDNYGDPRGNGRHAGIDMPNDRRSPLVAVEPGRVEYATSVLGGCMLYLYGRSGTMYLYIHLNNDLGPENDNRGRCVQGVAYSVRNGSRVLAGEQVGLVGDSGDQDGNPGLHFEVHPNGGADVNPFPYLKKATKPLFAAKEGSPFSLGLRGSALAAGAGTLRISATSVRFYPGGRWLGIDARPLEIGVPADGTVQGPLGRFAAAERLAPLPSPQRVAVFTAKARVTRDALVGAPGALTAARVSALGP